MSPAVPVGHAGAGIGHDPVAEARLADQDGDLARRRERRLRRAVCHELDAGHEPDRPDVADELELAQRLERGGEGGRQLGRTLGQALAAPDVDDGDAGRRGDRVAAEREDVLERDVPVGERGVHMGPDRDRGERRVAAAQALAHHEDVRHDAVVLDAEVAAGAPEAGDDLVDDQQHAVAVADLADAAEVVGLGLDRAADDWRRSAPR